MDRQTEKFSQYVEWVACDLCGANNYKVIYPSTYTEKDFSKDRVKSFEYANRDKAMGNVVECLNCRLVYMNPRDKNVYSLYEEVEDDYYFSSKNDRVETFERDLKELHEALNLGNGFGKKLLDVGSSYGFFLDVAKKYGWEVYGCELSKKQYEFAKRQHHNMYNLKLQNCSFPENYFDVITMFDVLEHVTSPSDFLASAYKFLKKDGMLLICTPDFSSWPARLMGKYWINFLRMHLYYFAPSTIGKFLERQQLNIVKITKHRRIIRLGVAMEWMKKHPLIYKALKILVGNRWLKDVRINSGLSGNMTVYAKKV